MFAIIHFYKIGLVDLTALQTVACQLSFGIDGWYSSVYLSWFQSLNKKCLWKLMVIVQLVFNWKKMENFIALVPRYVY